MDIKTLPIIVSEQILSFNWGRNTLLEMKKMVGKSSYEMLVISNLEDLPKLQGFVFAFVIGSDVKWIRSVFALLNSIGVKGIITNGDVLDADRYDFSIFTNQASVIKKSVEYLNAKGKRRLAMFGANINDASDISKTAAFASEMKAAGLTTALKDIYNNDNNITECFNSMRPHLEKYEAIICANDIAGIYLINECKKANIRIPEDLSIIGNGNLYIGNYTSPTITTFDDSATYVGTRNDIFLRLYRMLTTYPQIDSLHLRLEPIMLERESTGNMEKGATKDSPLISKIKQETHVEQITDPVVREICMIDNVLSIDNDIDMLIMRSQIKKHSYVKTSDELFISVDTVKYRLKKIYKQLQVHNRYELSRLIEKYGIQLG